MRTAIRGKLTTSMPDLLLKDAARRIRDAVRELQRLGIVDQQGKRIATCIPADMREGSNRDFGGLQNVNLTRYTPLQSRS